MNEARYSATKTFLLAVTKVKAPPRLNTWRPTAA